MRALLDIGRLFRGYWTAFRLLDALRAIGRATPYGQ